MEKSPRNIAVVLPNWIGDVVMATPTLRALRASLPEGGKLIGVMRPYVSEVLAGSGLLDEEVFWSRPRLWDSRAFWEARDYLRRSEIDQAFLLPNSPSSALLAWFSGIKSRVGYARHLRGPLLTTKLSPPSLGRRLIPTSATDYYLALVEAAGYRTAGRKCQLGTTPADEAQADAIWDRYGLAGRRVIVFNTGGAYGGAKHWPTEYYVDLAKRIADQGDTVLLICGPQERATVAEIAQASNSPQVHSLDAEAGGIGLSKAVIRRAAALVTTDSGPRHFAAAFDIPTISLFGSTDPRWADSYNPREKILSVHLKCSPCARRKCPLGHHRCMKDLTPDRVFGSLSKVVRTLERQVA